ncbi:MAG: NAD-dependent epimerase/dehydratase family protein, partial [bacterium]
KIDLWEGDVTRPETLSGSLKGMEVAYHLAGMLGQAGVSDQDFQKLNTGGTGNMLDLAVQEGRLSRFIYCGSAGVQGPIENPPAAESVPMAPSNIYETTKADAETAVIKAYKEQGLPAVVLRPELVYGPGDLHVLELFKAIKKGLFVIFGNGRRNLLHPSYIDDVTDAFLLCLEKDDILGEVFIVAAEKAVSVDEFIYGIADELQVRRPFHVPAWIGMTGAVILEGMGKTLGFDPPLNRARVKYFLETRSFDISKAKRVLGYQPKYDWRAGVAETVKWYRKHEYI